MNEVELVLRTTQKIANYQQTIQTYTQKVQNIKNMIYTSPVNWLAVMGAVLDMLSEDDMEELKRNDVSINRITQCVYVIDVLQQLTDAESRNYGRKLGCEVNTHLLGSPFGLVNDVRVGLQALADYKQHIQNTTIKFTQLKEVLGNTKWDVQGIVATSIHILEIIQEADVGK